MPLILFLTTLTIATPSFAEETSAHQQYIQLLKCDFTSADGKDLVRQKMGVFFKDLQEEDHLMIEQADHLFPGKITSKINFKNGIKPPLHFEYKMLGALDKTPTVVEVRLDHLKKTEALLIGKVIYQNSSHKNQKQTGDIICK